MKSRNIYTSDMQVTTVTTKTSSSSTYTLLRSGYDYLGVSVDTLNGNRKSPNPQAFSTYKSSYWKGSRTTNDRITETTTRVSGVISTFEANATVNSELASIAYNRCINEFYEKLRGTLDLSVDIAQSGQVVRMLRQAADFRKHVINTGRFLLRWKNESASAHAKRIGGKHLEWVYGWKPLASSIHDTIGNLGQTVDNMLSVQARASERSASTYTGPVPFGRPGGSVSQEARCMIKAEFRPPSGTVQNLALYSSLNPVSIAWEVLPYSFVVDWFYDLGGYLRNMESSMITASRFVSGFQTTGTLMNVNATCILSESSPNRTTTGVASSTTKRSTKNRSLLNTAPFPQRPIFKADLGSSRLLAAAALLSQGLNRTPR